MHTLPKLFKFKPLHVTMPHLFEKVWSKRKQAWSSRIRATPLVTISGRLVAEPEPAAVESKPRLSTPVEVLELKLDFAPLEERVVLQMMAARMSITVAELESKLRVVRFTDKFEELLRQRDDYRAALVAQTTTLIEVMAALVKGDASVIEELRKNIPTAIAAQRELLKVLNAEAL